MQTAPDLHREPTVTGDESHDLTLRRILEAAPTLHDCPLAGRPLKALAGHLASRRVRTSLETGCGASTLVFSHLSARHLVCVRADSAALAAVWDSGLLRPGSTEFLHGPTQITLPFAAPRLRNEAVPGPGLDAVLLDGPHAYPFPELEYYHVYPALRPGALLVLDDVHIPTVRHLFRFLRADPMFRLLETVERTAFFERTDAPTFDPLGDGWERQTLNRAAPRRQWRPAAAVHSRIAQLLRSRRLTLRTPSRAFAEALAHGVADCGRNGFLWLLARRRDQPGWWPQDSGPLEVIDGRWSALVRLGEPDDAGRTFEIKAMIVRRETHERWLAWVGRAQLGDAPSPTTLPLRDYVWAERTAIVRKERPCELR